ncbi:MAG: histidinol dehydrogenase [Microbacterium sp.]
MRIARIGTWLVAAAIGFVYGVAGTIGQAAQWGSVPLGLVIAVAGIGGLLLAVRLLTADRWTALAAGLGALIATLLFSGEGPGGSVVVPAPSEGETMTTGLVWSIAVPLITAIVLAWPAPPAAPPSTAEASERELDWTP